MSHCSEVTLQEWTLEQDCSIFCLIVTIVHYRGCGLLWFKTTPIITNAGELWQLRMLTFYQPRVSVIASPLTVSHYSGSNLLRKRTAYAFEHSCSESLVRLCPAAIIPDRLAPLCAPSCTEKEGGSHLCLYNSVICLDNCEFLWTNAFLTVFHGPLFGSYCNV